MVSYTKDFKRLRERLSDVQKKLNENTKKGNYNLTEETRIKKKLKLIQSTISEISNI